MSKVPATSSDPEHNRILVCQLIAWLLLLAVVIIAELAWLEYFGWRLPKPNVYVIFPLIGLLAFSLLWVRTVSGVLRQWFGAPADTLAGYNTITGWLVLALICLHPGLLAYQRYRDGFGLPPGNYESYVAPGLGWLTVLGSACLLVFLAYEFHRWFSKYRWWRYVQVAGDAAMLAVFYHGLRLGSLLVGWVRPVWWFYGLTLLAALTYSYWSRYRNRSELRN